MNEKPYLFESKTKLKYKHRTRIYLNATNAFSPLSVHSGYTLVDKTTTEIKFLFF